MNNLEYYLAKIREGDFYQHEENRSAHVTEATGLLDSACLQKIHAITRGNVFPDYIFLLCAFGVTLNKFYGNREYVIDLPAAMVPGSGAAEGYYFARMPEVDDGDGSRLLLQMRDQVLTDIAHGALDGQELQAYRSQNLFSAQFSFSLGDRLLKGSEIVTGLHLHLAGQDSGMRLQLWGALESHVTGFLENLIAAYKHVAQQFAANIHTSLRTIQIVTEAEAAVGLEVPLATFPENETLVSLFESNVSQWGDRVAVKFRDRTLTYSQLNKQANALAGFIRSHYDTAPDRLIGLMMERSEKLIVAMLAILKCGCGYVPIDPLLPDNRKLFIVNDSTPLVILADKTSGPMGNTAVIAVDAAADQDTPEDLAVKPHPRDIAYVIYTSGSTGQPKGVVIEHRNVVSLLKHENSAFVFTKHDTWTLFHSVSFDFSVWEIFGALLHGARLLVVDKETVYDNKAFYRLILSEGVTVLNQVPSAFRNLSAVMDKNDRERLKLRYLIFGGEALNPSTLKKFHAITPETTIINMYGITETTVHVTYKQITEEAIAAGASNIGMAIPSLQMHLVNDFIQLVPSFTVGEIVVRGPGVARGYLNNPDLTAKRFVENPYRSGDRMYLSGDLGMRTATNEVIYKARKDQQVKIRGFRIELGEIENRILAGHDVKDAVVVAKGESDERYLVAYVVARGDFSDARLRMSLQESLPDHMVPSFFVRIDSIPHTINGKVDLKRLPDPAAVSSNPENAESFTPLQQKLAGIWTKVLKTEHAGLKDNFFSLGGDSLKLIRLVNLINHEFGSELTYGDFLNNQTIESLASRLSQYDPLFVTSGMIAGGRKVLAQLEETILQSDSNIRYVFPLTYVEKGMIYSAMLRADEPVYYDQFLYTVVLEDENKFMEAFYLLAERHPLLKARYFLNTYYEAVKVVKKHEALPLHVVDLSQLGNDMQLKMIQQYLQDDLTQKFQFEGDLLWKMKLFRIGANKYRIVWSVFHALFDGWSIMLLIKDLTEIIRDGALNTALPSLAGSYKRYCEYELGRSSNEQVVGFWRELLNGYSRNKLPFNYAGRRKRDLTGMKTAYLNLPAGILDQLVAIQRSNDVSLKAVFLTAYVYLMHFVTGEKDIVTGVVTHERPPVQDAESITGCFLNTIPVRMQIGASISSLLKQVHTFLLRSKLFEVHLSQIAGFIGEKASAENPIFDCFFNYLDFHIVDDFSESKLLAADEDEEAESLQVNLMTNTLFDLTVDKTRGNVVVCINYSRAHFYDEEIELALRLYHKILSHMANGNQDTVKYSDLIKPREQPNLLTGFNDTVRPYDRSLCLHNLFEEAAISYPRHVAVRYKGTSITYAALNANANRIAAYLLDSGVNSGDRVALISRRTPEMIAALLGILKAGATYIPIDTEYPAERQLYIIEKADAGFVLCDGTYPLLSAMKQNVVTLPMGDDLGRYPDKNPAVTLDSSQLAYVIFTSGSTGWPKGVMIEHHSAVNLVSWVNDTFDVNPNDRLLLVTSVCFDLSVYDIFGILATGATLVMADNADVIDIAFLRNLLVEERITFWDSVPTTFDYLVREIEEAGSPAIKDLRLAFLSGDWIPVNLPGRAQKIFPNLACISLGGATEATVWSNYFPIGALDPHWTSIPYGKPIWNNFYYILDEERNPVAEGVAGELYIGGAGVARGYINDETRTAQAFVANPFHPHVAPLMYKTGDIGRVMVDGNIEFLGRKDFQVKIRGFRVEPGEVEHQLSKFPGIKDIVVVARKADGGHFLVAYFTGVQSVTTDDLKAFLSGKLPAYMVPSYFVHLDKIPLNSNGKVDRKALPDIHELEKPEEDVIVDVTEKFVRETWKEILTIETLARGQNIFEAGAHSLNIARFVNRVRKHFHINLPFREVYNNPTVMQLADLIKKGSAEQGVELRPAQKKDYYQVSSGQKRFWLLSQRKDVSAAYNMTLAFQISEKLDHSVLQRAVDALVERHETLRTTFHFIDGALVQKVHPAAAGYFNIIENVPQQQLTLFVADHFARPFDLEKGPLFDLTVLYTNEDECIVLMNFHHIIADGISLGIVMREIHYLYERFLNGGESELAPLAVQYKDYAEWLHFLAGPSLQASKEYWLRKFSDEIPALSLPYDFSEENRYSMEGEKIPLVIPPATSRQLYDLCVKTGVSVYGLTVAAIKVLLFKYCGQKLITIGAPSNGRNHIALENQVGLFLNNIPVSTRIDPDLAFTDYAGEVMKAINEGIQHQDYPYDRLLEDLNLTYENNRNPLYDVLVVMNHRQIFGTADEINRIEQMFSSSLYEVKSNISKLDLTFFVNEDETLSITAEYKVALFRKHTIEGLLNDLGVMLEIAAEEPSTTISRIINASGPSSALYASTVSEIKDEF